MWSKNRYTHNFHCRGINFAITHTHQLHNFNCQGINLCNVCVSLVSVYLASAVSPKGNYTTIVLREFISNGPFRLASLPFPASCVSGASVHQIFKPNIKISLQVTDPKSFISKLRWAKSRDSYRRAASESYRCDSNL